MLVNVFSYLIRARQKAAVDWLCSELQADAVDTLGMTDSKTQFAAVRNGESKSFFWDDEQLLQRLHNSEHTDKVFSVLWSICHFVDRNGELGSMVRSYVKRVTGIAVESVPFLLTPLGLSLSCDKKSCKGSAKKPSDLVEMDVDKNRLSMLVPISNTEMRELLFGRLRRISP